MTIEVEMNQHEPSVLGVIFWFMYYDILRLLADALSASDHGTHKTATECKQIT